MSIVGSVTVRVVPSFTGVHKQIAQQVVGTASKAGSDAGVSMSKSMSSALNLQAVGASIQNVGRQISSVGSTLTKSITLPAVGAATALGGIAIAGGFKRLVGIDTAQAQLKALGHDTESVEGIMTSALDAVKGTSFGLDEAATAAATAVAAGIQPGKELTQYLTTMGDAAAVSSTSLSEMAPIFNSVQTAQRAYLGDLNQLSNRGLPIYQWIAEEAGVTADAVRDMASRGEISSEMFFSAIEKNIGGAAAIIGEESFAASLANMWAAVNRIGAAFLDAGGEGGGFFSQMKPLMAEFTELIDEAAPIAENAGVAFGEFFTQVIENIREAVSWWQGLDSEHQKLILQLAGVAVAAGPVLLVFGKIITFAGSVVTSLGVLRGWLGRLAGSFGLASGASGAGGLSRVLGFLTGPIGWVITGLIAVWSASETFRESVINLGVALWDSLVDAFQEVWGHVQNLFGSLGDLWDSLSQGGGILDMVGIALSWLVDLFAWLLPIVVEFAGYLISGLVVALDWVVQGITAVVDWLTDLGDESTTQGGIMAAVWDWISEAISWAWENVIKPVWDAMVWAWDALSTGISWAWENIIKPAWDALVSVAVWMWENVIQPVWSAIQWAWDKLSAGIAWAWENVIKPAWDALVTVLTWLWENVVSPIFGWIWERWQTMGGVIRSVWDNFLLPVFTLFGDIILWLWENVAKPYFAHIWQSWQNMADFLVYAWVVHIWPMIQAFASWVMRLWNNYVSPALGWIGDKWDWLKDKLSDVWNDHIKPVLNAFANFVRHDVVDRVTRGIDMIKDAWETVKDAFARPINWVIERVWNNGIAEAFNRVSDAVGSGARMDDIPLIGGGSSSGSRGNIPGYAKGGVMGSGLKLVGEEGPELISTGPGWVATAAETQRLLSQSDHPLTPEEAAAAAGDRDTPFGVGNWLASGLSWVANNTPVGAVVDWARGGLADAAEAFLKPILSGVSSFVSQFGQMGQLGSGLIDWGVDELIDWIRGEDSVPEVWDGEFTANPGGFNRPANGPITSPAGPRSYVGRFGNMHYGVDIGVPIGSAIRAAFDGVIKSRGGGGLDQIVVVNHGGFDTAYMHNSAITKAVGSQVSGGDVIARSGTAGSGPHLHFELHPGGYYNPTLAVNNLFRDKGGLIYPGMNQVLNNTGKAEYVFNQRQFENLNRLAEQGGNGGRNVTVNQYGMDYRHADRNAQAFVFAERRESRKAGVR